MPAVAESAAPVSESQANAESQPQIVETDLTTINEADASQVMDRLGIPASVREKLSPKQAEQVVPEAEENPEPEAEAAPIGDEPTEGTPEGVSDETGEDDGNEEEEVNPRGTVAEQKLQKRAYKLRLRARRAEDKAAELEAKLAKISTSDPVVITPTLADPLAHIKTSAELEAEINRFKLIRDTARRQPNGWVAHEGTPQEYVVQPEEAAQWLSYAEDTLNEKVPLKRQELAVVRPQSTQYAKTILPTMFETGTQDYQVAQQLLRQYPLIATHPESNALAALVVRGLKAVAEDQQKPANGTKGKLDIPAKILKAHADRDAVPLQKQTPPGRSTPPAAKQEEGYEAAMAFLKKSGGGRNALATAIGMLPSENGHKGREPSLV